ncbi:DNA methyltransferase [Puniceibacterium sp. IMCC21224]|uniref:DNA methyltransferase n=1 Tax=Puniceibacterium sp. IMCC21224 TaxID=1618204 RepID=UPI00350EEA66
MPSESIDAVVTDPTYEQTPLAWDRWPDGWPTEVARVLKPTGSMLVFGTLRMFLDRRDDFHDWRMAQDIVQEKQSGSSMLADRFPQPKAALPTTPDPRREVSHVRP